MECPYCQSISVSCIDEKNKDVLHCSDCKKTFSFCKRCVSPYDTKSDPEGLHLCEKCKKININK